MKVPMRIRTVRVVDAQALYVGIGKAIRSARESRRMSQGQVAVALGMTRANVSNLEAGRSRVLLEHVYNVALLLDVPIRSLLP